MKGGTKLIMKNKKRSGFYMALKKKIPLLLDNYCKLSKHILQEYRVKINYIAKVGRTYE